MINGQDHSRYCFKSTEVLLFQSTAAAAAAAASSHTERTEKKSSSTMAEASVSSKRKRKSSHNSEKLPPQSSPASKSNKSPQQRPRVFSPEDSLALLKAFHEILKDSPSPSTAATLLFNRIGKSLSGEITQTQMIEKLRKLRQKYTKQAEDPPIFKAPYEFEIFNMSEKIWGEKEKEEEKENPPKRNSSSSSKKPAATATATATANGKKKEEEPKKPIASDVRIEPVAVIPEAKVDLWKKYSFLMEEAAQFPGNFDIKEGLKRLDETQLGQLNNRWKLQQIKEAEMLVKKTELIQEQTKLILEAFQN